MLTQVPAPAPVFHMDPTVTDFYAFTRDKYLRHLTCVSKRIREITNIPDCTVLFCFLHADLKIADTCLSARQELILQNIPRT